MASQEYIGLAVLLAIWYTLKPLRLGPEGTLVKPVNQKHVYDAALHTAVPYPGLFVALRYIMYGLVTGAQFVYWRDGPLGSGTYATTLALLLVNLVLNRTWAELFFDLRRPRLALFDMVLTLLTAIVILILMAVDAVWLAFGLFLPYTLWMGVTVYVNARFNAVYDDAVSRSGKATQPRKTKTGVTF